MKPINGYLMSRDKEIAQIINNNMMPIESGLLPLYFQRNGDLVQWLKSRAIDRYRPNARLLLRILGLSNAAPAEVAMAVNGATITDTYWIRRDEDVSLNYDQVRFSRNCFDNIALLGDHDSFLKNNRSEGMNNRTPELTNIGSFEKCWRFEDGHWWLYKLGNELEVFSELFIYGLGRLLGFSMAYYEDWDQGVKSLDFTNGTKYNYEPARSLVGDEDDYAFNYKLIKKLNEAMAKEYLDILFLDTICLNMDRHTENYGFLRASETGRYLRMAPNFDNNIALNSRGYPSDIKRKKDLLIRDFLALFDAIGADYRIPVLSEALIRQAMLPIKAAVDMDYIVEFLLNGYRQLSDYFKIGE